VKDEGKHPNLRKRLEQRPEKAEPGTSVPPG